MNVLFIILLLGIVSYGLFYFANQLSRNAIKAVKDERFQPLLDELKGIEHLHFKTVSSNIIYSNTISTFLKTTGYLLSFATLALALDFLTFRKFGTYDYFDLSVDLMIYLIASCIVFVLPLLSFIWNFTYFKHSVSDQIKNADIIFEYIKPIPKKILSKYTYVFTVSYLLGRVAIDSGFAGALIGTVLYEISISIYYSLEAKRLGLAPLLNLICEKIKLAENKFYVEKPQA